MRLLNFPLAVGECVTSGHAEKVGLRAAAPDAEPAAEEGQIPVVASAKPENALQKELMDWVTDPEYSRFPMYDNFVQAGVFTALTQSLPAAFVGRESGESAANAMADAQSALTPSEQEIDYGLGS